MIKSRVKILAPLATMLAGLILSCVIAEPPGDLPQLPERRPTIVRGSVVPTVSAVLGTWPDKFILPVEMSDPRSTLFVSAFVDYNPSDQTASGIRGVLEIPAPADLRNPRIIEVPLNEPTLDRCHTVEIIVALRFNAFTDPNNAHTPAPPGGDSVSWFFSPTGDLAGCPVLDAGITPAVGDAEADGSGGQ